jgi:hypothetical protein
MHRAYPRQPLSTNARCLEVQHQAGVELQYPQIREHLRVVDRQNVLDAFDFNDDTLCDDQVGAMLLRANQPPRLRASMPPWFVIQ